MEREHEIQAQVAVVAKAKGDSLMVSFSTNRNEERNFPVGSPHFCRIRKGYELGFCAPCAVFVGRGREARATTGTVGAGFKPARPCAIGEMLKSPGQNEGMA